MSQPLQPQQPPQAMPGTADPWEYTASVLRNAPDLVTEPGLVFSLAQAQAHPADAGTIGSFVSGLQAQTRVQLARATPGVKIPLSDADKAALDGLNVKYDDVEFTHEDAATEVDKQLQADSAGMQQALKDSAGKPVLDSQGNIQVVAGPAHPAQAKNGGHGWFSSFGDFFGHLGAAAGIGKTPGENVQRGAKDILGVKAVASLGNSLAVPGTMSPQTALGGLSAPLDLLQSGASNLMQEARSALAETAGGHGINTATGEVTNEAPLSQVTPNPVTQVSDSQAEDMRNLNYDPDNPFSVLAYKASGKAHLDTTDLAGQWDHDHPKGLFGMNGDQAVATAVRFQNDPVRARKELENDPNLTPDQINAQLAVINSPDFVKLGKAVGDRRADIGSDLANRLGLKDGSGRTSLVGATNIAASFMADPVFLGLKGLKVAREAGAKIGSFDDVVGFQRSLDPANKAAGAQEVQKQWTWLMDKVHGPDGLLAAEAAGDQPLQAGLLAQIRRTTPWGMDVLSDVAGNDMVLGWRETSKVIKDAAGVEKTVPDLVPITGKGPGLKTLDDVSKYAASRFGIVRFSHGFAAANPGLMPGALSGFGFRKLRGELSGGATYNSMQRSVDRENQYLDWATDTAADPGRPERLINEGMLVRMQPQVDDAVDSGGNVIAQRTVEDGTTYGLKSEARGTLRQNVMVAGTPIIEEAKSYELPTKLLPTIYPGHFSPSAIAERARLATTRLAQQLPRNTVMHIDDNTTTEKLRRFGLTYLNRGDSALLAAQFALGDDATRKTIMNGIVDQVGGAAGLSKTVAGQNLLDETRTANQAYSSVGNDIIAPNGQKIGMHVGEHTQSFILPDFRALQQAAAKISIWEATMGRALTSPQTDFLMHFWKFGKLGKFTTVTRNALEAWGKVGLDEGVRGVGEAVRAKGRLMLSQRELWDQGLAQDTKATHDALLAAGDTKGARLLSRQNMFDTPYLGRSTPTYALSKLAPIAAMGRYYRSVLGLTMDARDIELQQMYSAEGMGRALEGFGQQSTRSELGMKDQATEAEGIIKAGLPVAKVRYRVSEVMGKRNKAEGADKLGDWIFQGTDGIQGAQRYANALARKINDSPDVARTIFDHLQFPNATTIDDVIHAIDTSPNTAILRKGGWGQIYWRDPTPGKAYDYAKTPEQASDGKYEWAQRMVDDYRYLVTGANGNRADNLMEYVRQNERAPDPDWILSQLPGDARPAAALAPEVVGKLPTDPRGLAETIQDVTGAVYQWGIERTLQRTTTGPIYAMNYLRARRPLDAFVDHMVQNEGISQKAAESFAEKQAERAAWIKTEQMVDDPGLRTQLDIVGRNFFAFSRAMQAMVRRYGVSMWQDPSKARKLMLALEGAEQSGMIYHDPQTGELTFTYPGSGVMSFLLRNSIAHIPGFENVAKFPLAMDMTGKAFMAVPGADDPFRMAMSPMINVPMRFVFDMFPDHRVLFNEIDRMINGPIGSGQHGMADLANELTPTLIRQFGAALSTDQRNSMLASATMGAMATLAASGYPVPRPDAPAREKQAYKDAIRDQVRAQLAVRGAVGYFVPAAPSAPIEDTSQPDYAFAASGARNLSDEYKQVLNDVDGDVGRANAIFLAGHPERLPYTVPKTASETSHAYLPATTASLDWMEKNGSFIHDYKDVAAYFIPDSAGQGEFDHAAYQAQLEFALRQRKTPDEFYQDIAVKGAEAQYYPTVDAMQAQIDQAKEAGNDAEVKQLTQTKSDWVNYFLAHNPLFEAKVKVGYEAARQSSRDKLDVLRDMLGRHNVPDGQAEVVAGMIQAWDGYEAHKRANPGSTRVANAARKYGASQLQDYMGQMAEYSPIAKNLYNGIFRPMDVNLMSLANYEAANGVDTNVGTPAPASGVGT